MYKTYYVSSLKGREENDGLTPETPYVNLEQINRLNLCPGDKVLLECGSVFENQFLHVKAKGTKEHIISIGKYGEGNIPCIAANGEGVWNQDFGIKLDNPKHRYQGSVSSAILLEDVEYLELCEIEITNQGNEKDFYNSKNKMCRTGVAVIAKNGGTLHHIILRKLMVHHVEGNIYDKHMNNGGIYITALKPDKEEETGVARFSGITIENCFVYKVSRWGIAVGYTYQHDKFTESYLSDHLFKVFGQENIVLRNNYVKEAGGDGITPMYCLNPIIEHNIIDSVAGEINAEIYTEENNYHGMVAAGIWPWKCKNAVFRYNEVLNTRLNQDGMAFDADSGEGTLYEYNYSRLNEGGCVMFCLEQAVENTFRYNLSVNDLGGTISPAGNPDALIKENIFYKRKDVPFIRRKMAGGKYTIEGNQIIDIIGTSSRTL